MDYIIQNSEIVIIDHATGRLAEGRQWQDGLYQAVQQLDRQLTGRCARQGQPGTSRTFVAADDSLLCQHGRGLSRYLARRLKPNAATEPLWNAVTKAARKSESEMSIARARLAKRERQREEFISISDASPEPKT